MSGSTTTPLKGLATPLTKHLTVTKTAYSTCLSSINHSYVLPHIESTLRFHYLLFSPNGALKLKTLVDVLADHLTSYAVSAERRANAISDQEKSRLYREARKLLRKTANSGEAGELLLYFLIESVLEAPQVITKVSLKTNPNDEVKGADGVHIGWSKSGNCLIAYFGESKIYSKISEGIASAVKSINKFYAEKSLNHEIFLVTSHFNLIGNSLKKRVLSILNSTSPEDYKIVHVCLFGFDWTAYNALGTSAKTKFITDFEKTYLIKAEKLTALMKQKSKKFKNKSHLSLEIFFVPFKSVSEFRKALRKEI